MGSVPLLLFGAERAPQGFLADVGFNPAAAAGMGLMACPANSSIPTPQHSTAQRTTLSQSTRQHFCAHADVTPGLLQLRRLPHAGQVEYSFGCSS
jgi:hypothetical protein